MTYEEAVNLKSYKNHCDCGGYAHGMTDRSKSIHPHMLWCYQYAEFEERAKALRDGPKPAG